MESQESGKFPVVIGGQFTPHIASTIFNLLDKQELTKSRSVSSTWKDVVDSRTNLWTDPELYRKAALEGNIDICQLFLDRSEDKNPKDVLGRTPLHFAAEKGFLPVCQEIMQDTDDKNPKDRDGNTPLHWAAGNGHLSICQLIVENVDDKNPKDNDGCSPLDLAKRYGHKQIQKLIENATSKN